MSLTINQSPSLFGWARNRSSFKLHCSGIQQSSGSHANFIFYFSTLGATGSHVVLVIDGREIVYTVGAGTDQYSANSIQSLISKMASNFYVNEVFTPTADTDELSLQLYGTNVGAHKVEIYTTDADGARNGGEAGLISTVTPRSEGLDKKNKDNYAVTALVEVTVNNYNAVSIRSTEPMVFHPDKDNYVNIPLDVVAGFIPQPDLPTGSGSAWQLLTNALLKFRIRYGEMWGSDVPQVQNMAWSDYFFALCGEMTERYAAVNMPDWKSGQVYQIGTDNNIFWVVGLDTGMIQHVRQSQPEWIYGLFYKSGVDVGDTVNSSYNVTVSMTGKKKDGSSVSNSHSYNQVNGQVYRIDVSPSKLASSDLLWYTVTIETSWGEWSRTYHVLPDLYDQYYLLLQDKYGLLRVAVSGKLKKEVTTEGEEMVLDKRRYINVSRKFETYTATLEGLTREASARIGRSVGNEYHYIQIQGKWVRVVIEPDSFLVLDDSKDLLSVEMKLRFVEDQQENGATGSLTRANASIFDDDEQVLSFDVITDPIVNNLF